MYETKTHNYRFGICGNNRIGRVYHSSVPLARYYVDKHGCGFDGKTAEMDTRKTDIRFV